MGDSTSLLSESDSFYSDSLHSSESFPNLLRKHAATLDDAIEQSVDNFSTTQLWQVILINFTCFFDAQQTFISAFTDIDPNWHYTTTVPPNQLGANSIDTCQLPEGSWAWDQPANAFIVSEWGLLCSSQAIAGLPSSFFFMGCLMGGLLFSTLADSSLGRKTTLNLSCLVMSLASTMLALFSTNIWIYSIFKFVVGFGRIAIGSSTLVLSMEMIGKKWRGQASILGFLCFTLGFLSLPAVAYLNRGASWRVLYLWTSLPAVIYSVLMHFLVCESPRWLFVQGRKEEAVGALRSITNSSSLTLSFFDFPMEVRGQDNGHDPYSALKVLLQKRWALRRISIVMMVGLGLGMIYYAMPLALGDLAFENLYLSVTFNALAELPAALVTFLLIRKMNRRSGLLVFCMASGVCSIGCAFMSDKGLLQVAMELASFFTACTAVNVTLIYTIELFPTCIRNSALSMMRQAVVAGGVVGPVVVAAGRKRGLLSFAVFGMVTLGCGLFAICLPETRGQALRDTMDEEEYNGMAAPVEQVAVDV